MLAEAIARNGGAEDVREAFRAFGNIGGKSAREIIVRRGVARRNTGGRTGSLSRRLQRGYAREFVEDAHAQIRSRIASATSLVRSLFSLAGPTHEGQPLSQGHAEISSRVRRSKSSCTM